MIYGAHTTNDRSIEPDNDDIRCDRPDRLGVCDPLPQASETVRPSCIPVRRPRGCTLRWGLRVERILKQKIQKNISKKSRIDRLKKKKMYILQNINNTQR